MTFVPIGKARLDLYTDAMLLDIGPDTFVVPRAWKRHPEGGWTVDFSTPMEASKEPLPEIVVEDD